MRLSTANLKHWAPLRTYFEIRCWLSLPLSFHMTAVMRFEDKELGGVDQMQLLCSDVGVSQCQIRGGLPRR